MRTPPEINTIVGSIPFFLNKPSCCGTHRKAMSLRRLEWPIITLSSSCAPATPIAKINSREKTKHKNVECRFIISLMHSSDGYVLCSICFWQTQMFSADFYSCDRSGRCFFQKPNKRDLLPQPSLLRPLVNGTSSCG